MVNVMSFFIENTAVLRRAPEKIHGFLGARDASGYQW
jgi:hypothetical protein